MERVNVKTEVLRANDQAALENRGLFEREAVLAVNVMSAPGAGKTSVLESTIRRLAGRYRLGVIEGDLQTSIDSERIRALGVPSFQITTGTVCHLDARMVARAVSEFPLKGLDVLFIENVGNLICPASYDLGEHLRVVVYSVVEGVEKPKKYPVMFHRADVVLLNKIDLIPYSGIELQELCRNVVDVNPRAAIFPVSCRSGVGFPAWLDWLRDVIDRRVVAA